MVAFLFAKELATTSGDSLGDGEGVETSFIGCPEVPPAKFPLAALTALPDLGSKSTLEAVDSGEEGIGKVLPDLPKAPPDLPNPGLYPGECGDVCGSS